MTVITKITYIATGNTLVYNIPFDYLSKNHVIVTVDGEAVEYVWSTAYIISFLAPPPVGSEIVIKRETPNDEPWTIWRDGSVMVANKLNAQQLQALYVLQENQYRIRSMENSFTNLTESLASQQDLLAFAKYAPVPFGGFYVDEDGNLCLTVYGEPTTDTMYIDEDGNFILEIGGLPSE